MQTQQSQKSKRARVLQRGNQVKQVQPEQPKFQESQVAQVAKPVSNPGKPYTKKAAKGDLTTSLFRGLRLKNKHNLPKQVPTLELEHWEEYPVGRMDYLMDTNLTHLSPEYNEELGEEYWTQRGLQFEGMLDHLPRPRMRIVYE